jgi:hypothetical protein
MSTDSHGPGEQPTAPIPRTGRNDDPTQIFETFGTRSEPGAPRTEALPTGQPPTQALPTADEPRTQALPTDPAPTRALPVDATDAPTTTRVSAFGADAGTARPAPTAGGGGGRGTDDAGPSTGRADAPGDRGDGAPSTPTSSATSTATSAPTSSATSTATATMDPPATAKAERPVSRTLRVGTVVWGLIIAIIGAGLVSVAGGARFDLELVLIGLLALAGVALVVGSLAVSMRRRR